MKYFMAVSIATFTVVLAVIFINASSATGVPEPTFAGTWINPDYDGGIGE